MASAKWRPFCFGLDVLTLWLWVMLFANIVVSGLGKSSIQLNLTILMITRQASHTTLGHHRYWYCSLMPVNSCDARDANITHKIYSVTTRSILLPFHQLPRLRFNIKMSSYRYRKSHCGDKTVVRSSYLHNGISFAGKMTSLYWISPQKAIQNYINSSHNPWYMSDTCTAPQLLQSTNWGTWGQKNYHRACINFLIAVVKLVISTQAMKVAAQLMVFV